MARWEPVGAIRRHFASGSWDEDRTKFICCVDGRQPEIHEVYTFREDVVTREDHPTARVDVGTVFFVNFLPPITLLQLGVGSLFLEGFLLMEAPSGSAFLTS